MKKIIFIRNHGGGYNFQGYSNTELDNLLDFFISESCGATGDDWIRYLKNTKINVISGNMIELQKKNNQVILSNIFCETEDPKPFKTNIKALIKIIMNWVELYNKQPDEIILTYQNGTVTFEGKGFEAERKEAFNNGPVPIEREIHVAEEPHKWFEKDKNFFDLLVDKANEAYHDAQRNEIRPLYLKEIDHHIINGYTKGGIKLKVIFEGDEYVDSFPLYRKKNDNN